MLNGKMYFLNSRRGNTCPCKMSLDIHVHVMTYILLGSLFVANISLNPTQHVMEFISFAHSRDPQQILTLFSFIHIFTQADTIRHFALLPF